MTYKNASQGMQARLRRFQVKDVRNVKEDLSISEKADVLRKKKDALCSEKSILDGRIKELGAEIQGIQIELCAMGVTRKYGKSFPNIMLDIIKAEVTVSQWKIWVDKAKLIEDLEMESPA